MHHSLWLACVLTATSLLLNVYALDSVLTPHALHSVQVTAPFQHTHLLSDAASVHGVLRWLHVGKGNRTVVTGNLNHTAARHVYAVHGGDGNVMDRETRLRMVLHTCTGDADLFVNELTLPVPPTSRNIPRHDAFMWSSTRPDGFPDEVCVHPHTGLFLITVESKAPHSVYQLYVTVERYSLPSHTPFHPATVHLHHSSKRHVTVAVPHHLNPSTVATLENPTASRLSYLATPCGAAAHASSLTPASSFTLLSDGGESDGLNPMLLHVPVFTPDFGIGIMVANEDADIPSALTPLATAALYTYSVQAGCETHIVAGTRQWHGVVHHQSLPTRLTCSVLELQVDTGADVYVARSRLPTLRDYDFSVSRRGTALRLPCLQPHEAYFVLVSSSTPLPPFRITATLCDEVGHTWTAEELHVACSRTPHSAESSFKDNTATHVPGAVLDGVWEVVKLVFDILAFILEVMA